MHSDKDRVFIHSNISTKSANRWICFSLIFNLTSFFRNTVWSYRDSFLDSHSVSVYSSRNRARVVSINFTKLYNGRIFFSFKCKFLTRSSVPRLLLYRSPPAIFFTIRTVIVYPIQCSILWSMLFTMLLVAFIHVIVELFKATPKKSNSSIIIVLVFLIMRLTPCLRAFELLINH